MMSKPLLLNVFRLPTDNDGRRTESWDNMGLRKLTVKCTGSEVTGSVDGCTTTVNMTSTYTGKGGTAFDVTLAFIVCADGTVMVNSLIRPVLTGAVLPRLGFRTEMPAAMEQLQWFGRGPWDSYRDRKEACLPGIYRSTVSDQQEDYILPQEHGTKQEVRWLSLTNAEGQGLLFVAPDQMAASAVHFRPEDNYTDRNNRSRHTYQFKTCTTAVVSLDAATRGLGNASCGPDVLDKYELTAQNTTFSFIIMPLAKADNAAAKARISQPFSQPVLCERQSNGRIKLTTQTPDADIWYSIDNGEYKKYTSPIVYNNACTVATYSSHPSLAFPSPTATYDLPLYINKSAWRLVSADSQHSGNEARLAFDGKNDTFWHTEYWGSEPVCPHTIVVDMSRIYNVTAFTYLARQDGNQNGMVKAYEVYLSTDGKTWGQPAATGEFKNTTALQAAKLKAPVAARYLKLVAKSEINGNAWTSAAEIGIDAESDVTAVILPHDDTNGDAHLYDLQGRLVTHATPRGIYIRQGQKILK